MGGWLYFDIEHAINVHDEIIVKSGGTLGQINVGLIEGTLTHVQDDGYYPTFEDKLTYLFYSVNKNHGFVDGNKRSAIALSAYFMEINGFDFRINRFLIEMENIAVDVAADRVDRVLLREVLYSILYEEDYSEELKLKIVQSKVDVDR